MQTTELIYNIAFGFLIVFSVYCFSIMTWRIRFNKKYDEKLGIKTQGTRKAGGDNKYHRTESTPYLALLDLKKKFKIDPKDGIVDYGSGKGRVAIFLHDAYKANVTGVEVNEITTLEAIQNWESYKEKHKDNNISTGVTFENNVAEKYKIKDEDKIFFFFNTFHVDIFKDVVKGIEKDAELKGKEPTIILYFPTLPYVKFLQDETRFSLQESFACKGSVFPSERFSIYKYKPKQ